MITYPFNWFKKKAISNAVSQGNCYSTINARSALKIGIHLLGLSRGDEVLLPAYHCPVMVYPLINSGLVPVFYKIFPDCSADLKDITSKKTSKTKAVISIHYFGFPNNISEVQKYCRKENIFLIEDCAHAFFGKIDKSPIGSWGDIAIASLWKFFPICDGGFLILQNKKIGKRVHTRHAEISFQVKSAINTMEMGNDSGVLKELFQMKDKIWSIMKSKLMVPDPIHNYKNKDQQKFEDACVFKNVEHTYKNWKIPWFSYWIYTISNQRKIIVKRRYNYSILNQEIKKMSGIKPLFTSLPSNVVPYNFPVILENPDKIVNKLREKNINISRFGNVLWEGMPENICKISSDYSTSCIQLPIHQSLSHRDIMFMVDVLRALLQSK